MVEAGQIWADARFLALAGIAVPIVQAPMAGAGGSALAAAAIAGGALGSLPCAMLSPDQVRAEFAAVRRSSDDPINLNFFCHRIAAASDAAWRAMLAPYYSEYSVGPPLDPPPPRAPFSKTMCEVVEELRPRVVSFHFGLPDESLLARVKAAGIRILASATTVAEARWLAARGCDAIIAQGWEAGGHASRFLPSDRAAQMGLMALLPQIVDAVDVPVVAAGGIGDARGIAAALMLGASAVQLGTAYLHCPESLISEGHRAALQDEAAERTVFTNVFTGGLARAIPNRLLIEQGPVNRAAPPFPHAAAALADLRKAAEARGDTSFSPLWSGQAARLGARLPARELTQQLATGAYALLTGASPAPRT